MITGITNFGVFVQLDTYLAEGLVRYEDLMDDWWDVDSKAGVIKGERSGTVMRIGDAVRVRIMRVDVPRRELDIVIIDVLSRGTGGTGKGKNEGKPKPKEGLGGGLEARPKRTGGDKRDQRSRSRDKRGQHRESATKSSGFG